MPRVSDEVASNHSLRDALFQRGYAPDEDGALAVPLWELPNTGGHVRRWCKPGARHVLLRSNEDHALPAAVYQALTDGGALS